MKLGLFSPVVRQVPGLYADWERHGTIEDVCTIARAADRLGYDYLACAEHVLVAADQVEAIGPCWWDPLVTLGYVAAHTSQIRLATLVIVLPFHHPLDIAKRYGTLDRISGGRVVLGVGTGSQVPEFEVLGVPLEGRGDLADDAIRAIRASFGRREPQYEGTHYRFGGIVIDPCGAQADVPLWVGGRSRRSLRRAVELADAWCPNNLTTDQVSGWLRLARQTDAWHAREKPLEVALSVKLDPLGVPKEAAAKARELQDAGATALSCWFVHDSVEQCIEQVEAMGEVAAAL